MKQADSPYLTDLLAISLRWLALFGMGIALGAGGVLIPGSPAGGRAAAVVALTLPALWNGFISALAIFNQRLAHHREINLALDILFGLGIFAVTGGLGGPVAWAALLPIFTGAIYFDLIGALIAAVSMSLGEGAVMFLSGVVPPPLALYGIVSGANVGGALLVGLLSRPVVQRLRVTYRGTVNRRLESERSVQRQEHDRMRERARALFTMIETFSSTLNYQTVLETALQTAIQALEGPEENAGAMVGAVMLYRDDGMLEATAARGFAGRDMTMRLPGDQGALNQAFRGGEAVQVQDIMADPELSKLATMQAQVVALCLPLIRGMNAYGVMVFGHNAADFFTAERIETLQMLGNQAVIALQNARLYQDLTREKERILQSQEDAQKKLARDLHDGPTQSVAAIAMRLAIARRMLERSPDEVKEELAKVEDLARRTTQEIRHMLFTLRPLVLETEGLDAALKAMADKMRELYQQNVRVEIERGIIDELDPNRQTVVFYLAEEAVNNARKHAQSSEIVVRLRFVPKVSDVAMLEVCDNGVGFNVQAVMDAYDRRGSLGMVNLRERAEQIDALLKIESTPGNGTRIRIFIPLTAEAADRIQHRKA